MGHKYIKLIFYGYITIIAIGAALLSLPIAHNGALSVIDALFTSASATCVTGLIVKSTAHGFTFFGKIILLVLIQIGGIGYMSLVSVFFVFIKSKLNISEKRAIKESMDLPDLHVINFLKKIVSAVIIIEGLGAIILSLRFYQYYDLSTSIWYGIFHSISAFNNAGFSLFDSSLENFQGDSIILMTISLLIVLGGMGYVVLVEIYENRRLLQKFSLHTKLMLYGTVILIVFGVILFLSTEWSNPETFGNLSIFHKLTNAIFLSVNFRTSGFNSIDVGGLKDSSLFFSTIFMMIGAGQGSTAGGIKVTTVALLIVAVIHVFKDNGQEPNIFSRRIEQKVVNKALAIILCASFLVLLATLILEETQDLPLLQTLFEVVSAFGTVGVSTGNGGILSFSQEFNVLGKSIIIILMLTGRLGVFALGLFLVGKVKKQYIQYPKGRIII